MDQSGSSSSKAPVSPEQSCRRGSTGCPRAPAPSLRSICRSAFASSRSGGDLRTAVARPPNELAELRINPRELHAQDGIYSWRARHLIVQARSAQAGASAPRASPRSPHRFCSEASAACVERERSRPAAESTPASRSTSAAPVRSAPAIVIRSGVSFHEHAMRLPQSHARKLRRRRPRVSGPGSSSKGEECNTYDR
jgi:hypothetical protein